MTARFGRNKRRRAREDLAASQEAARLAGALASRYREEAQATRRREGVLRLQLDTVRRVLVDGSVALPPDTREVSDAEYRYITQAGLLVAPPPEFGPFLHFDAEVPEQRMMIETQTLDVIEAWVERSSGLHKQQHLYLRNALTNEVSYAIAIPVLKDLMRRGVVEEIADLMVRTMVKEITGRGLRRRG